MTQNWRVGNKVPINVYAGNRPVCQRHCEDDAYLIVSAVNSASAINTKLAIAEYGHKKQDIAGTSC